jgi:predicted TIM-barrel fold metal-dependent hydrolase
VAKNGFKLIDAELHVMEPVDLWERYIDPEFRDRAPRRMQERSWDIRTIVEGEVMASMTDYNWSNMSDAEDKVLGDMYADGMAANFDPASQLRAMDTEGLDLAVLYPTSGMYITAKNGMDPRFAEAACRAYNNWLNDFIQEGDPKRMFGAAAVSPHDVETAVIETRRAVEKLGFKAIFLRPNMYNGRSWHDPHYDPLWATAQDLGVAIGFHETTGSRMPAAGADRFPDNVGIAHIATHSIEQMMACMDIIMGGVMERFPRLQFAFLEGQCGWLPFWLDRMDDHYEWRHPYGEMQHLKMEPSHYFHRQGYAAVECGEVFVSHVIDAVGDERLLTTSDYPHGDAKYPHTMDTFMELPISDANKKKILWDNPARLYGL